MDARTLPRMQRRALMPIVSAWVDALAEHFGPVRVEYAREGDLTWGEPEEWPWPKRSD